MALSAGTLANLLKAFTSLMKLRVGINMLPKILNAQI